MPAIQLLIVRPAFVVPLPSVPPLSSKPQAHASQRGYYSSPALPQNFRSTPGFIFCFSSLDRVVLVLHVVGNEASFWGKECAGGIVVFLFLVFSSFFECGKCFLRVRECFRRMWREEETRMRRYGCRRRIDEHVVVFDGSVACFREDRCGGRAREYCF